MTPALLGCVVLSIGQVLCYSADNRITCSDTPIPGVETCKALNDRVHAEQQLCVKQKHCPAPGHPSVTFSAGVLQ